MLVQKTESDCFRSHHVTAISSFISTYQTKDSTLAGSIPTYEADVFSSIYLERSTAQHVLHAVGFMNI